jgi:hypothetical protein
LPAVGIGVRYQPGSHPARRLDGEVGMGRQRRAARPGDDAFASASGPCRRRARRSPSGQLGPSCRAFATT